MSAEVALGMFIPALAAPGTRPASCSLYLDARAGTIAENYADEYRYDQV